MERIISFHSWPSSRMLFQSLSKNLPRFPPRPGAALNVIIRELRETIDRKLIKAIYLREHLNYSEEFYILRASKFLLKSVKNGLLPLLSVSCIEITRCTCCQLQHLTRRQVSTESNGFPCYGIDSTDEKQEFIYIFLLWQKSFGESACSNVWLAFLSNYRKRNSSARNWSNYRNRINV